eukprot:TRINITY_DN5214_c1_g1_i1.p1 TRINITY_DN5214_c1_g1~~TRINITY_DN5214_c1_g1_i1.p1  ORF type:complete len:714 (+),score=39.60 TRINITY_DN5214_c1_g1_i1:50-2143(+)
MEIVREWVSQGIRSLHTDVADLLSMCARSIRKNEIPYTWEQVQRMDIATFLSVAPVVTAIFTVVALLVPRRNSRRKRASYHLTRVLIIRMMALCYLAAFLTQSQQYRALYSKKGIMPGTPSGRPTPALDFLSFLGLPSGDWSMEIICYLGVVLSVHMLTADFCTFLTPLLLWLMHITVVNSGGNVINYGWEWLTAEVGFITIFLHPIASRNLYPLWTPPSGIVIFLFRWCAFRLMIGAGMSKMGTASSPCWKQLSCTETHYFTQPLPSPLAWYAHYAPELVHKMEVAIVFVEQLILPFLILLPMRRVRIAAGVLEVGLQLLIIATGNYAWINFIGIVPVIAAFDDVFLWNLFPRGSHEEIKLILTRRNALKLPSVNTPQSPLRHVVTLYQNLRVFVHLFLLFFCIVKSGAPLKELFGSRPWLHFYDEYFFLNAHGVFGFINKERVTLLVEYSHDDVNYSVLDFHSVPGRLERRPSIHTPYHYRLDWETWIYTTASLEGRVPSGIPQFLEHSIQRLMQCDTDTVGLFAVPYDSLCPGGAPPTHFRARYFRYFFSPKELAFTPGSDWWVRTDMNKGFLYSRDNIRKLPKSRIRKSPDHNTRWLSLLLCVALFTIGVQKCNAASMLLSSVFFSYTLYYREYQGLSLDDVMPAIPVTYQRYFLSTFSTLVIMFSDKVVTMDSVVATIAMISISIIIIMLMG